MKSLRLCAGRGCVIVVLSAYLLFFVVEPFFVTVSIFERRSQLLQRLDRHSRRIPLSDYKLLVSEQDGSHQGESRLSVASDLEDDVVSAGSVSLPVSAAVSTTEETAAVAPSLALFSFSDTSPAGVNVDLRADNIPLTAPAASEGISSFVSTHPTLEPSHLFPWPAHPSGSVW